MWRCVAARRRSEVGGRAAGGAWGSQAARQLRHNSPRTYNQTIAIIINRYTFNDRVCRTQRARCKFDRGQAQATLAFGPIKFSCYIRSTSSGECTVSGVRISEDGAAWGGAGRVAQGAVLRTELAESMICGAVSVHLATAGRQSITQRNKDWEPCVTVRATRSIYDSRREDVPNT